ARANDDDEHGQEEQQIVVFLRTGDTHAENLLAASEREFPDAEGIDSVDALRSIGDIDRRIHIVHEDSDDLPKAQSDNGQIITSELKRRRAQQRAGNGCEHETYRQNNPERQMRTEM